MKSSLLSLSLLVLLALMLLNEAWTQGPPVGPSSAPIPSLVGTWHVQLKGFEYRDVLHPTPPDWFETPTPLTMWVNQQHDRFFYGNMEEVGIFSGAFLPDGTVTILTYGGNSRNLFNGRLEVRGDRVEMTGLVNGYEEIGLAVSPGMGTGFFRADKVSQ